MGLTASYKILETKRGILVCLYLCVLCVCERKYASIGGGVFPLCKIIFITHCKEISARVGWGGVGGWYNTRRQKRTRGESVARQKEMGNKERAGGGG